MSGCIFSNFESGECQLYEPDIECNGYDKKGVCICEDDPNPYDSCENFEPIDPEEVYE